MKVHGASKRRKWIKLHIDVDPKSQEVVAAIATNERTSDNAIFSKLIDAAPRSVKRVAADGAYDCQSCRKYLDDRNIEGLIPPRRNARPGIRKELNLRNDAIDIIHIFGGDEIALTLWKKISGYSQRSLVETAFSRLKRITGDKLRSRGQERQKLEALLRCHIMNRMTRLYSDK